MSAPDLVIWGSPRAPTGNRQRFAILGAWPSSPPAPYCLLRAKDLADARYFEPLGVDDLARAAGLSRAHFGREFRRAFGESPHSYLLTRRMERAATLLRNTDHSVAEVCLSVGLQSIGSFTASFSASTAHSPPPPRLPSRPPRTTRACRPA